MYATICLLSSMTGSYPQWKPFISAVIMHHFKYPKKGRTNPYHKPQESQNHVEELTKPIRYLLYIPTIYTYHIYTYTYHISYHITQPCSALSRPGLSATRFSASHAKLIADFLSWSLCFKLATPLVRGSFCSASSRVLGVLGSRPAASHSPNCP